MYIFKTKIKNKNKNNKIKKIKKILIINKIKIKRKIIDNK